MTLDEALGEAVTGWPVTCQALGLDNWLDYTIGGGWRVNLATGASYKLMDVADPRYSGEVWYYWKEPHKDGWGKLHPASYGPWDAVLKEYEGEAMRETKSYSLHLQRFGRALRPVPECGQAEPGKKMLDWIDRGQPRNEWGQPI